AERNRLRRLADALNDAGVLHREEALRHRQVEQHGQAQSAERHQQRQRLVSQHPGQPARIAAEQSLDPVRPGAFLLGRLEQLGAHHRRQGQRHHQGNQDGYRQRDGELAEQPPHHVLHEQQWNQHGDQREGQRDQREADLLGALERRIQRRLALFQVPRDVLQHDDGVVYHEPGGDGQRHQRQVVQREARQVHHREGADQRQRYGYRRDDRRREFLEEDEGDHHHQDGRQHQ